MTYTKYILLLLIVFLAGYSSIGNAIKPSRDNDKQSYLISEFYHLIWLQRTQDHGADEDHLNDNYLQTQDIDLSVTKDIIAEWDTDDQYSNPSFVNGSQQLHPSPLFENILF